MINRTMGGREVSKRGLVLAQVGCCVVADWTGRWIEVAIRDSKTIKLSSEVVNMRSSSSLSSSKGGRWLEGWTRVMRVPQLGG